jgi:hypothetical protein
MTFHSPTVPSKNTLSKKYTLTPHTQTFPCPGSVSHADSTPLSGDGEPDDAPIVEATQEPLSKAAQKLKLPNQPVLVLEMSMVLGILKEFLATHLVPFVVVQPNDEKFWTAAAPAAGQPTHSVLVVPAYTVFMTLSVQERRRINEFLHARSMPLLYFWGGGGLKSICVGHVELAVREAKGPFIPTTDARLLTYLKPSVDYSPVPNDPSDSQVFALPPGHSDLGLEPITLISAPKNGEPVSATAFVYQANKPAGGTAATTKQRTASAATTTTTTAAAAAAAAASSSSSTTTGAGAGAGAEAGSSRSKACKEADAPSGGGADEFPDPAMVGVMGFGVGTALTHLGALDLLLFLARGRGGLPVVKQRWIGVDIDDIFMPNFHQQARRRVVKIQAVDVQAMRDHSRKMSAIMNYSSDSRYVPKAFKFNLGFNIYFYGKQYGNTAVWKDAAGDEAFVRHKEDFYWFDHTPDHEEVDRQDFKTINKNMDISAKWAKERGIVLSQYTVTPKHSGINPCHDALYSAWLQGKRVLYSTTTANYGKKGFIYRGVKVAPRQDFRVWSSQFDWGGRMSMMLPGHNVFQFIFHTVVRKHVSVFMTHQSNYARAQIVLVLMSNVLGHVKKYTNIELLTDSNEALIDIYFSLFPNQYEEKVCANLWA